MIIKLNNTARKGQLYVVDNKISMAEIVKERLSAVVEAENDWLVAKDFYGERVASQLLELFPNDPFILRDLMVARHLEEGKTGADVEDLFIRYSEEDWGAELAYFLLLINKSSKIYHDIKYNNPSKS